MDAEQLIYRINTGQGIRAAELEEVVATLNALDPHNPRVPVDEVYSWILVLGRAHATECRRAVERFLSLQDSETIALILEILCGEWGFTEEYLEHLLAFALGQMWDPDGDVQGMALKLLGEYVHGILPRVRKRPDAPSLAAPRRKSKAVLALLLSLFEDEELEPIARQKAYYAMLRAGGVDWEDMPSEYARIELSPGSKEIDWDLISETRHSLSSLESDSEDN